MKKKQHMTENDDTIEAYRIEDWSDADVKELQTEWFSTGKTIPIFNDEGTNNALYY
jgi:hypothetical protein